MGTAVVRYKPTVNKTEKPKAQTWKTRLCRPWLAYCDTRALVSVTNRLHLEHNHGRYLGVSDMCDWILAGDYGGLPSLQRADVQGAFADRSDIRDIVPLLVGTLVGEGVLIPEIDFSQCGVLYQLDPPEVSTLVNYHQSLSKDVGKKPHLKLV
jgi:hypothetical protein